MTSQPSPYAPPMPRACITCGAPTYGSRCPTHSPHAMPTPARTHYKDQHGYAHQLRRKRMVTPTSRCAYAHMGGCHGLLQLDYIIPLSLGGQATDDNAQILCERHNIAKGGRNRLKTS